jgi:hypothetical protein
MLTKFIQAMICHPYIQVKTQYELDTVLPQETLLTLQNMEKLPYVTASVRETHWWDPIISFGLYFCSHSVGSSSSNRPGVPRYLEVEETHNGFRIPAKAIMISNAWLVMSWIHLFRIVPHHTSLSRVMVL